MQFYVGVTDRSWYDFLSTRNPKEVNFWRPKGETRFRALQQGGPFVFKLKKRFGDYIVGAGFFQVDPLLPIPVAWDYFEQGNGAPDYLSFLANFSKLAGSDQRHLESRDVRCIVLGDPVFFPRSEWIESPPDWHSGTIQGKTYSTMDEIGASLWSDIQTRLVANAGTDENIVRDISEEYRNPDGGYQLTKRRLGQGVFRVQTLENYQKRCCITGESTMPVLEAAHIKSVAAGGEHRLNNGLAMRADMHKLYDRGLISVDSEYRIRVSRQIRDLYHNGIVYYAHEGKELKVLPKDEAARPNREHLDWHFKTVFVA